MMWIGRNCANKENKNCEAVSLEGGAKARVIDKDPDSLFFRSTVVKSINALREDCFAVRGQVAKGIGVL